MWQKYQDHIVIKHGARAGLERGTTLLSLSGRQLRQFRSRLRSNGGVCWPIFCVVLMSLLVAGAGACVAGEYAVTGAGGTTTCAGCPAGLACDGSASQTACGADAASDPLKYTYSLAGSATCSLCPAGYSCASAAAVPTLCAPGTTSAAGSASCSALAATQVSPDGVQATDCGANQATAAYYVDSARNRCLPCPPGHRCPTAGLNSAVACPSPASYSLGLQQACTPCPSGSECPDASAVPALCPPGTYALAGGGSCITCPAGWRCPTTTSAPVKCLDKTVAPFDKGEYSYAGSSATACAACPEGHECSNRAAPLPLCALGTFALAGAASCTPCPAGELCPSTIAAGTTPPAGAYAPSGSIVVRDCPDGQRCPTPATAEACPAGQWSGSNRATADRTSCIPVPAGYELPAGANTPVKCPLGHHSTGGAASCSRCAWGTTCPGSGSLALGTTSSSCTSTQLCFPGTFEAAPVPCPSHMDCSTEANALKRCTAGSYLSSGSCISCPAGFYCTAGTKTAVDAGHYSEAGDSRQHVCPAGFACPGGASAVSLAPGEYADQGVGTAQSCPIGSACPDPAGFARKLDCQALSGYYADVGGLAACKVCPAGWSCPAGSATKIPCSPGAVAGPGSGTCEPCRAGYACPDVASLISTPCSLGTYSTGGQATCQPCPVGHYCSPAAATPCPRNHYAEEGAGTCWLLPAGVLSVAISGTTVSETKCDPGHYKAAGPGSCAACPAAHACANPALPPAKCRPGEYQDQTGQATCKACGQDAVMTYSLAGQAKCRTCPTGHRCATATSPPVQCPMGTWAAAGKKVCSPCTDGFLCQSGSDTATPEHSLCPAGFWCAHTSDTVVVTPCAAGSYSPNRGAASAAACLRCPAGKYCPLGTSVPLTCTTGAACEEGATSNFATPCPAGEYRDQKGGYTAVAADTGLAVKPCKPCPEYYFCPERTTYPVKCLPGYVCAAGSSEGTATPCLAGTYGGLDSLSAPEQCKQCPEGHYCPEGSVFPVQCGPGTYQPTRGAEALEACQSCPAGTVCPFYGLRHAETAIYCGHGHACPAGTKWLYELPCAAGTYSDAITITDVSQCQPCPERYACPQRTGKLVGPLGSNTLTNPKVACAAGHWCPQGTASPTAHPCPAGTYTPEIDNREESDCIACPAGQYCSGGGALPNGPAAAGHYCPIKSSTATAHQCPAGTYQPVPGARARGDCLVCLLGHYCPAGSTSAVPCGPGTYGRVPGLKAAAANAGTPGCTACPAGWQCPGSGTVDPVPCGAGFYSGVGTASCPACLFDRYCDTDTTSETVMNADKKCAAGYICAVGTAVKPYHVSATYSCQPGSWCANSVSSACAPGTWQPLVGASSVAACLPVPAGHYAPGSAGLSGTGATTYAGHECGAGYFCPTGSTNERGAVGSTAASPCPEGSFRGLTKGGTAADCGACPAGRFCPANTRVPFTCPLGYYCLAQTVIPTPCPRGTFGHSPGLRALDECSACWGGRYCSQEGLAEHDGLCDAGYYCSEGAFTAAPVDGTTGALCPAGGYCPRGSKMATHCPAGTYNPNTGKTKASDCSPCPKGKYCAGSSNPAPTGPCQAGYYCPAPTGTLGARSPTEVAAEPGHYTEAGAWQEQPCAAGDYNPYPARAACLPCAAGRHCPDTGMSAQTDCGAGYWCGARAGSAGSARTACPAGTYGAKTRAAAVADCTDCPAGSWCAPEARTAVSGLCDAGSFCLTRAIQASYTLVTTTATAGICPLDHYCEIGTGEPPHCGDGFWSAGVRGLQAQSACSLCPPGEYCQAAAASQPAGLCSEGYYCPAGSSSPTPSATPCPPGSFCPTGSPTATLCPAGSYQPQPTKGVCIPCPAGHFCEQQVDGGGTAIKGAEVPSVCGSGRYCPAGTGSAAGIPCPIGTYSALEKRTAAIDCLPCDPGSWCAAAGQEAVSGSCDEGHYCTIASPTATPGGALPAGYQTTYPVTKPGGRCTSGHYCPAGSPIEVPCPAGYFCPDAGMTEAQMQASPCTAGRYCGVGLAAAGPPCPKGRWCPSGSSTGTPCRAGTYNPDLGASTSDACLACPATKYCAEPGLAINSGTCARGYLCRSGASVATPPGLLTFPDSTGVPSPDQNGLCPAGVACPAGAAVATVCDGTAAPTDYQDEAGQWACKTCPAGYWCTNSAIARCRPDETAESFHCPASTRDQVPCPAGTINHVDGSSSAADCKPCPPGSYCPVGGFAEPATTSPKDRKSAACPAGSYCLAGAAAAQLCPKGFYCPAGSNIPVPCEAGQHCSQEGEVTPTGACAAGWWCTYETVAAGATELPHCAGLSTCVRGATSAEQTACPAGAYCLAGSHTPTECPIGTFYAGPAAGAASTQGATSASACQACSAGSKCPHRGMAAPGVQCQAGYYCPAGSATETQYQCPAGSRCPTGSDAHRPCQSGTYQPNELSSSCLDCPAGRYCPTTRATAAKLCPAGYHCGPNTAVEVLTDSARTNACPTGYESALVGLQTAAECQRCAHGKYCATPALASYTSACAAGYYCDNEKDLDDKAIAPATSAEPAGRRCQAGQYCAQGTIRPSECPPGTYGVAEAALQQQATSVGSGTALRTSTAACDPCPAGRYCPSYGLTDGSSGGSAIGTCPGGYLCLSGARHPSDLDNNTISLCPAGSYCPATRAAGEGATLCPRGTYQPSAGQTSCLPCPGGFECEEAGATAPRSCAKGHYCAAPDQAELNAAGELSPTALAAVAASGASNRRPCPAGTYGPNAWRTSSSDCLPCLPGYYCGGPSEGKGRSTVDGSCAAGYACVGGASSATPSSAAPGGVAAAGDASTPAASGPCPPGRYCPAGTPYPVPCPPGTYQPTAGQSSCLACPLGKYCPTAGGASAASLPACADGFYCVQGASNAMPTGGATGRLCAMAHFCVGGLEAPCPAGSYGPRAGLSSCPACPAGYFCEAGVSAPAPCPNSQYCPAGSAAGTGCPAGTYTPSSTYGLESADQCLPCPTGKYCRGGASEATGLCPAGAFCVAGASGPTQAPGGPPPDYSNKAAFPLCPAGFFCEAGTTLPTACPAGTYSAAGSVQERPDCGTCEAGYYCRNGTRQELICPAGHYCEAGVSEPAPCPRTTYRQRQGGQRLDQCRDCPAGAVCDETGISDLLNYACSPGHYCPKGTLELIPCPVGAYQAYKSGRGAADCQLCTPGYFCSQLGTVSPQLCTNGTYCPGGDAAATVCPAGSYCPAGSTSPIPCPAGFYCEGGSEYFLKCQNGTYCPFGSSYPTRCPGGTFGSGNTNNVDRASGCLSCGRGAYSTADYNFECLDCPPGYVCLGETNSATPTSAALHKGYRCPKGHHCPLRSYKETPCPVGTYSKSLGAAGASACLSCKIGWYNDLLGQAGCRKCGPSANTPSTGAATTCTCAGANRRFIKSTGSCLCETGFKPKNGADPAADAASDCELIVKEACAVGVEVDVEGNCVKNASQLCAAQCGETAGGQSGVLVAGTGLCQCAAVQDVETVCDAACRATQIVTSLDAGGKLTLRDPTTGAAVSFDPTEVPGFAGVPACGVGGSCRVVSLGRAADGAFTADYGTNARLLARGGITANVDRSTTQARRRRALESGRLLQAAADLGEAIRNPVMCVNTGAIVLFDVDSEERRYPVYVKDSILNTNQDFDRAPFDELAALVENGVTVRTWAAAFVEKGIYVFADSKDASKLTVIAVKASAEACKDPDANIQSMTTASLSAVGIESQAKSVQPNWSFIVGTFVILLGFNFGLVGAFVYLRNRASMKLASGQGDGATIYYDKVAGEEAKDRERRSCRACLGGSGWRQASKESKSEKVSGPNYQDLARLLEDFKQEYVVLQEQLQDNSEGQKQREEQEGERSKREEELLDERIKALQELKDFVRENQACLREYLGIEDGSSDGEQQVAEGKGEPTNNDRKKSDEAKRLIARSQEQDQEFARQQEEDAKGSQEAIFSAELEESDRLRAAAMEDFKKKMANSQMANEDSQALLGEMQGKLGSIDALIQGEEEQQNQHLRDALERRRRRRAGLQEKAQHLADKKGAQEEKSGRKLRAIKEHEQEQLHRVDAEIEEERERGLSELEQRVEADKQKKLTKLQKALQDFNKRSAGLQGELAFTEKLSEYKSQVADVEAQADEDRNKQRLALEERLRKRRAAGIKAVEESTKVQEVGLIEEMQEKSRAAGQELEAVQAMLHPVFEEDRRLAAVAARMAETTKAVVAKRAGVTVKDAGPDAVGRGIPYEEKKAGQEADEGQEAELLTDAEPVINNVEIEATRKAEDAKVEAIQNQLQQEVEKTTAAAAKANERRRELKKRLESTDDEGEKRRLLSQLDQVDKDWAERLAQENDLQQKRLKSALEERRRARKKAKDEADKKTEAEMVKAASTELDGVLNADETEAEEGARRLVGTIAEEFSPDDVVQATEGYLDRAHQKELADLMNSMFAERSKVLKKMLFEMMAQKQGEYELIGAEFEPQYAFLKEKKSKGLIAPGDYKTRLERLSEEESDRKMDVEIEYNEREQRLQEEVERARLEKEAALKGGLKQRQHVERRTALQELQGLHQDQGMLSKYLKEQEKGMDKELRHFKRQVEKEKTEALAKIEETKQARLQELNAKEQKLLNWEGDAKAQEEKHLAQFAKQKEAILKQKQMEQKQELTRGLSKEEAAKLMQRHREDMNRLEGALADEQKRQMEAMRARLANRNKDAAAQRVQRQIKMAAVHKRKAQQRAVAEALRGQTESLDDANMLESKEALAKCLSKAGHMKRLVFKGGFSQQPEQRRRVVERTLDLEKRLGGEDPLAAILDGVDIPELQSASGPYPSARQSVLSDDTIVLTEYSNLPARDRVTFKELLDHVERVERDYAELAGTAKDSIGGLAQVRGSRTRRRNSGSHRTSSHDAPGSVER